MSNVTNIKDPGYGCDTNDSHVTPSECPVCPDNNLTILMDNGEKVNNYITLLENNLMLPKNSLMVIAIDDSTKVIEVFVDSQTSMTEITTKLRENNYYYHEECSILVDTTSNSSKDVYSYILALIVLIVHICF